MWPDYDTPIGYFRDRSRGFYTMTPELETEIVGKAASSDIYHYLDEKRARSLCGHLNNDEFLGPKVAITLSEADAKQRNFRLCDLCDGRGN